jgi:hypothetical protein
MTKPNATRSVSFVERAQAALIVYPRFRELHREIQLCQRMSKLAGEPQCMSLEGRTGTGKSTLVRTYADSFHRTETKEGTRIPVLYLEVPSPVGIKDLASVALKRMGDPAYERGTRASMTMRLIGLIKDCGVELVILDDFHHLIDSETNHILTEVSEWLKYAARETLQPFRWETANPQTIQEFAHFVDYVEKAVEKPLSSEVRRTEMLYRIHYATDGVVGNVMNLIRFAAMLCEMRGKSAIGLAILSLAFQQRLAKHLSHKCDPFSESVTVRFTPSVSASSTKPGPVPRGRRRKKHEPSIAETLTTR